MISNQTEFNEEYSKEEKEIKIKRKEFQEQSLVIANYSNLEKLYLRDIKKLERLILKDLFKLKDCTIWDCGTKELVVENCPWMKKINVHGNLLISLEFLKDLESLEELEIDNNTEINSGLEYLPSSLENFSYENTKLVEILKIYKGDWKACKKDIQKLINQTPYELLKFIQGLKVENQKLKEKQLTTIDNPTNFEQKYQSLKETLNSLLKKEKIKTEELVELVGKSKLINTATKEEKSDIATGNLFKKIKEDKDKLSNLRKVNQKLVKQLAFFEQLYSTKKQKIEQKEKELEELKNQFVKENKEDLEECLENQAELVKSNYSENWKKQLERSKKRLFRQIEEEKVNLICQLQAEITQLKLEIQKNFNQANQIFHINSQIINQQIKNIQGINIEGNHNTLNNPSVQGNTLETITYEEETELQTAIESPPPKLLK